MIETTRRSFLVGAAGGMLTAPCLAAGRPMPTMLGANTAVTGYGLIEAIELIRQLEFPAIEIQPMGVPQPTEGEFPGFDFDRLSGAQKRRIRRELSGFSHVTSHLPYVDLHSLSRFAPVAEFSRSRVETAIEGSAYFGSELVVLHPEEVRGRSLEQSWTEMIALYRRWGDMAKARKMKMALETGFPRSVREFTELIEAIDHSHVGATLDVGHQAHYTELLKRLGDRERGTPEATKAYNDVNMELVERLGPKLFHLHIHDIDPMTWAEHKPLEHGFVDYPRLLEALDRVDYKGILMFEIGGDPTRMADYLREAKKKLEDWM
jgi:sugar phosphate isomerase/epimerase